MMWSKPLLIKVLTTYLIHTVEVFKTSVTGRHNCFGDENDIIALIKTTVRNFSYLLYFTKYFFRIFSELYER